MIDSKMFADIDVEDASCNSSEQQEALHSKTRMVLDKQLEIIRKGNEFLENFRKLMEEANTAKEALGDELKKAHGVELKLNTADKMELNSIVSRLVLSVNTAVANCETAVVTVSDDTKKSFKDAYDDIGRKMKAAVDDYMKKRVGATIDAVNTHCNAMEDKVKGHFMSNTSYFLHYFLLVVSRAFGLWGAWYFVPIYLTETMGWSLVVIAGIAVYGFLVYRLRDM